MAPTTIPAHVDDPVNAKILAVSEDRVQGFHREPLRTIAEQSEVELDTVITRIAAMLREGTIRRVRQTLMSTSLAPGALVAWRLPGERIKPAFEFMFREDPFSGHVVTRSTDRDTPGSDYKLWTTLKVPRPYDMEAHCRYLAERTGATAYKLLPAKKLFALGVGHVRRREIEPGDRTDEPGRVLDTEVVDLTEREWRVLTALKREFEPEELRPDPWAPRAQEAGETLEDFCAIAEDLTERNIVGRFSTFLEHYKQHRDGTRVTRYNALFHWRVPEGAEIRAGQEVGRHHCMTHAYWREGGPEFAGVNIMGVSHGTEKDRVLAHKAAIDEHLEAVGIPVEYTNVFWGGRSEIKPSEVSPFAYRDWCLQRGLDPEAMRA
ncbi:Lrp/AsnC family transcriptional regulator [Egibacter rhizosphaerae]|uniref:Lrp/AsnC family transcriptional regulator n=1 Tax=Egibacter rhizosphaerae TaxID=1670831 RepID=A0A411YE70_9ACTN|nr:Lrp/AsnC family transcriptional regulator [Egibacter rhizosphaerae]QBI19553.1 Lrp/AsnC family transcriptional regulator [Egibacter rhizosphaerae]